MCRPPLCAAVGSQNPLELVNLLIVPCKVYRGGLGVGELETKASALAYAMLSGQHDVVKAVSTQALLLFASSTQRSTVPNLSVSCYDRTHMSACWHHHYAQT